MKREQCNIPIIDKKATAKRMIRFMKERHLTPGEIQEYLGLACVQTVYRWLEGINIPSIDHLYALSYLFQVEMDDMIAGNRAAFQICAMQRQRLMAYCKRLQQGEILLR